MRYVNKLNSISNYYFYQSFILTMWYVNAYTSQTCSRCGNIDKENRQTQETFVCTKCGFKLNADHNAAINIARSIEFM